jgi:hypothetical protein
VPYIGETTNLAYSTYAEQFDVLWNNINTGYVFWDVDETDWDEVYEKFMPQFEALDLRVESGKSVSTQELKALYEEAMGGLIDHHMSIQVKNFYSYSWDNVLSINPANNEIKKRDYYYKESHKLSDEISQSELADYYEKNKSLFVLDKSIVKGLFIKVPLQSTGLADVRRWYKKNEQEAIEKLEKYSLRNAVTYDYFYDSWRPVDEIEALVPAKSWIGKDDYLNQNRNIELKDTAFVYFLHIEEFQGTGKQKPLDFASEEIKEILINLKRVEFINKVKEDLYRQASDKNKINYYYLNSDE